MAVIAALAALGAGSFFLFTQLTGKKSDSNLSQNVNQSQNVAPAPGSSQPPTPTSGGNSAAPSTSANTPTTSTPTTSSQAEIDAAAVKQLDQWASDDLSKITISDSSYGARLSSKWVGIGDDKAGHPQGYTAKEILDEIQAYKNQYGDELRVVKTDQVGLQNSKIKGHSGWMAVVINSETSTANGATAWCNSHYDDDNKCGMQHLNPAHDN